MINMKTINQSAKNLGRKEEEKMLLGYYRSFKSNLQLMRDAEAYASARIMDFEEVLDIAEDEKGTYIECSKDSHRTTEVIHLYDGNYVFGTLAFYEDPQCYVDITQTMLLKLFVKEVSMRTGTPISEIKVFDIKIAIDNEDMVPLSMVNKYQRGKGMNKYSRLYLFTDSYGNYIASEWL